MDKQKVARKKLLKFFCKNCDYKTSKKSSWNKHVQTIKHQKSIIHTMDNKKVALSRKKFYCICGKKYAFQSGLCKHKRKCSLINEQNAHKDIINKNNKNNKDILNKNKSQEISVVDDDKDDLKNIFKAFMKSQTEFNKKISEEISKPQNVYNNNNSTNMTINLFLNENCKNAMNLTDFVDNLKITLEDLEFTKNNGYIEGVTNIFAKQLQDLAPTERPIHCSDKKRLQFYVKDDDKWKKDQNNEKIDETLTNIKLKQTMKIGDWEKLHPNYREDAQLLDEWQNMLAGITENTEGNILKQKLALKRKIASYIELKEAMGIK